jgi:hypothetical protein
MGRTCTKHGGKPGGRVLVRRPEERDRQEDLDIGGRIILKWILHKYDWVACTGMSGGTR